LSRSRAASEGTNVPLNSRHWSEREADRRRACELYAWNAEVSAAFYMPLQAVEIGLRNAMERELSGRYGGVWYDASAFLVTDPSGNLPLRIQQAKDNLGKRNPPCPISYPQLVTELSFGFWTGLLATRHEHSLWVPCLRRAFPNSKSGPSTPLPRSIVY
jgi:hypothetical protein